MNAIRTLPQIELEVNGAALPDEIARTLAGLHVRQQLSLPAQCELVFRDPPEGAAERLVPGMSLSLALREVDTPLVTGEITACEHVYEAERGHELRVRGYDLLHRLRKRQRIGAFAEVTARDLASELVRDLNLSVEAQESGPFLRQVIQHHQSDLELLNALTGQCGLHMTLREGTLLLLTLAGIGDPIPLRLRENLLEARIEVNADPACRTIEAAGWSPSRVEAHLGRATRPRGGRDVSAEAPPSSIGSPGETTLFDLPVASNEQADAFAQAELDWRIAREVTIWGVADGDPNLRPGAIVDVHGVDRDLAGRYVLASVTHHIDDRNGYLTEFSSDPPPPRPPARSALVVAGVVTRVDDPDGLARVRVSLPAYGDTETDWLGVLTVAAGSGKGFVAMPDVGDDVLVLCAQGDPARGVVLGGLYGARGAPDAGVANGSVRRFTLLTPGGQRVTLDDERARLRVENDAGSFVELAPDEVRLHARADLLIEAPGQSLVIQAGSIDFRRA